MTLSLVIKFSEYVTAINISQNVGSNVHLTEKQKAHEAFHLLSNRMNLQHKVSFWEIFGDTVFSLGAEMFIHFQDLDSTRLNGNNCITTFVARQAISWII